MNIISFIKERPNVVVIAIVLFLIALSLTTGINIFEDVMFLFWIIVPVLIGLILIKKAIENHNFLKKVENTATSKIRSVAIGLVEIKGKTVLKEELISPINEKRLTTYEDKTIVTAADREKHFGQKDHLREFGVDYALQLKKGGFEVVADDFINTLSKEIITKYALLAYDKISIEEIIFVVKK